MMKPNITPVGTFQRITSTAPLRAETREAIQNTVLQFYVQNSQPEDDAEGLTACYERLSQEDKLDGESNSIINQLVLLSQALVDKVSQMNRVALRTTDCCFDVPATPVSHSVPLGGFTFPLWDFTSKSTSQ